MKCARSWWKSRVSAGVEALRGAPAKKVRDAYSNEGK
jgi:hypothetical protein